MIEPLVLLAFVPASLALNLTPGADMMFCLAQGMRYGPRAALAASAGISCGAMVHVLLAGLGVGAAVAAQPWLFDAIRWAGVAYLLYLAFGAIRHGAVPEPNSRRPATRSFRTGILVNLSNPKVILFVLAFVPQFVDPSSGAILVQFLILGAILALGGFAVNGLVGVFAGRASRRLTGNPRTSRVLGWITGGIFAALAARLAILERA